MSLKILVVLGVYKVALVSILITGVKMIETTNLK